ncbi:beta-propeller domain-containing protein [Nocardioides montaniterrae]
MSDLEKNWDDLPVGPVPIDAILHEAHRVDMRAEMRAELRAEAEATALSTAAARARRRRAIGRPLVAAAAVSGVAAALVVGINAGGGNGGSGGNGDLHAAAFQADVKAATSCDDLLGTYRQRAAKLVTAWGWGGGPMMYADDGMRRAPMHAMASAPEAGRYTDTSGLLDSINSIQSATKSLDGLVQTQGRQSSKTGTNTQESGVDEPDTVKTDGKILAQLHDDELWLYDVSGHDVRRLSSMPIQGIDSPEMLLSGHTLVLVGADSSDTNVPFTRVTTIDLSDPRAPKQTDNVTYSASLLSARQHGDAIRLVLSSGLPDLDFTQPHGDVTERDALKANRKVVADSTIRDWLPIIAHGSDDRQLLDCTDVGIPDAKVGLDTVSVVGFEAGTPNDVNAIGLAGATDIAYESTDHLYLVASPTSYGCFDRCLAAGMLRPDRPYVGPEGGTSYLFDFALNGDKAVHVASGEVEGRIRDRWSMDEKDGVLRMAVGPTSETGSFNSLVTMKKRGEELFEIGRVDGIGRNEELESARWFDNLAILVTYRNTDPMFAIDLTKPSRPRLIAKVKLPGYSAYLHPLGPHRLIGVGVGPGGNTQVGLFNTTDMRHLHRIAQAHFHNTDPLAANDPRSFTWEAKSRTALTVIERWGASRVGYLASLEVRSGKLVKHKTQVEYGDDVDLVRAVPLGDGRVVVTTGEGAHFWHLAPTR